MGCLFTPANEMALHRHAFYLQCCFKWCFIIILALSEANRSGDHCQWQGFVTLAPRKRVSCAMQFLLGKHLASSGGRGRGVGKRKLYCGFHREKARTASRFRVDVVQVTCAGSGVYVYFS